MNVFQMTQSFQSIVESIATTNPTDKYVTKDLFQNCMATVANNIIELGKSVNQLTWGVNAGIQTLTDKLENSEETTKVLQSNNTSMSERFNRWDTNHTKLCNNIRELSDSISNMDKLNSQNITVLSDKLSKLEENNFRVQSNIKDISDRLQNVESNHKSLHQTTVILSDKVSKVCESVDNLQKSSFTILSNYQNQQDSIESLTNNITSLQEKSAQVITHSTPKPPPGLPHRNISNTPFFIPKPPPGFHTHAFMPLQRDFFLSQADFCLEENQSGTTSSGEFSPVPFSSVSVTDICDEIPVSETDVDGKTDLSHVSVPPTNSCAICPADSNTSEVIMSPISNKVSLQSAETKSTSHSFAVNQSDTLFQSVLVLPNSCQSLINHNTGSSLCDSGIASILDQTSHQPSPTNTLFTSPDKDRSIQTQIISHISSMSGVSQVKTGEECSKQTVNVYTCKSSHQSVLVEYADAALSQPAPIFTSGHSEPLTHSPSLPCIEGSKNVSSQLTVEVCWDTSLTDKALSGGTSQFAVFPLKSFEQVRQSEGHREYGRQHPVRRPWKLMYHTLRWLKPFK